MSATHGRSGAAIEPFVHPTAVVDGGAELGPGVKVWHFVHVSEGARIGAGTSLGQNSFVGRGVRVGERVKVQNNVSIYEGVVVEDDVFLGPSCVFTNVNAPRAFVARMSELATTRVGRGATVGANATIVCGHDVGAYAFVGAGAVVTRDVPAHALVVGNPARRIGWVSRVGRRLPEADAVTGETRCPETGERYRIDGERCEAVTESGSGSGSDPGSGSGSGSDSGSGSGAGSGSDSGPDSGSGSGSGGRIDFVDLRSLHERLLPELRAAFERVVASGTFVLGGEVAAFEREAAAFLGVEHAIGVSSGTDALLVALMALGVGPGDEVITTPFSFFATVGAIVRLGATPVFADVEAETLLLDPRAVERVAGPRTRAVIPVHLFGRVADVPAIRQALERAGAGRAAIVEDAAQAFGGALDVAGVAGRDGSERRSGARWVSAGALGDVGCFSFFPTKVLGALGDGGLVTTRDGELAERVRRLRVHGAQPKYHHAIVGGNFRLDALQAAMLRVKLPHLAGWREARRKVARRYRERLEAAGVLDRPDVRLLAADGEGHAAAQLAVLLSAGRRDPVRAGLAAARIATEVYYPEPLHLQPALAAHGTWRRGDFPHAERAAETAVCLPLGPEIADADVDRVVGVLVDAVGR